ncbi:SpoIIE family protein phosphatase [Leptospira sp. 2 VSF19]|uniref:SpoIIE family protein phosphatase n=1 Tax=Leptospira soteropolitanensis TaxID=2950025 RepID=A0AAW5VJP5_9LEPT|nr:7TM diverse intracellular signaling domain-containing protein [Leptospira soteropolitanensis]MCW7492502.1 SpoIIE family protein phosphatase [Leptospira soteropolitanensis]MCW7500551.1 SpoIIE family protein phosphatase [Leptospira soteropolitanensis]MCW7522779.1 SpoIIE family protein phosphatase [Leptospira soteropolitanensis]MCW7526636.1 SpoIIE family protein phosphatase [Leptospira soteropolitanensis]MCW7530521.1 SpoIIE family protein phosphatase [Leptospira soteropolitanensis]
MALIPRINLFIFVLVLVSCGNQLPKRPLIQYTFESKNLEEVISESVVWSKAHEMKYHFGYWKPSVWVKFEVVNSENEPKDYILELESPWVDEVLIGWVTKGKIVRKTFNGSSSFSAREVPHRSPVYKLTLEPLETKTIYAHIKNSGILNAPFRIWEINSFFDRIERDYIANGVYFGIIFALLLYNLLIYISVREKAYIYYCLYLATLVINYSLLGGFFKQLLVPELEISIKPYLYVSVNSSLMFVGLYSLAFLDLKKINPRLNRMVLLSVVGFGVLALLSFLLPSNWVEVSFIYTFPYMFLLLMSAGAYSFAKGTKSSSFFLLAWFTLFIGVIADSLTKAALIPFSTFGRYGVQIGTAFEVILFSLALGRRLRFLLEENLISKSELTTIKKDLETARKIQMRILPDKLPQNQKLTMEVSYLPLYEIGGDFYDFFEFSDGFGLVIADVTGHGVSAALDSSTVKIAFRNAKEYKESPGELVAAMNRFLCTSLHARFVTVAYFYLDLVQMKLHFSSAGSPPFLIVRNGEIESFECPGLLLGVRSNSSYEQKTIPLLKGDRLVIFTDGLYENLKPGADFTSILFPEILPIIDLSQIEFHQKLLDRLSKMRQNSKDDITLISLDIH